jgi:hypothetical protein
MKIFLILALLALMTVCVVSDDYDYHDDVNHRHSERCTAQPPAANETAKINADIQSFERRRSNSFSAIQTIVVPTYFVM